MLVSWFSENFESIVWFWALKTRAEYNQSRKAGDRVGHILYIITYIPIINKHIYIPTLVHIVCKISNFAI